MFTFSFAFIVFIFNCLISNVHIFFCFYCFNFQLFTYIFTFAIRGTVHVFLIVLFLSLL